MRLAEVAQDLWINKLRCRSDYDEKFFKALFEKNAIHPICKTVSIRLTEHQFASLEDFTKSTKSLVGL